MKNELRLTMGDTPRELIIFNASVGSRIYQKGQANMIKS